MLREAAERLRLVAQLAPALDKGPHPDKVRHALEDMLAQRIYGLALDCENGDGAARLYDDPAHRLLLGRSPAVNSVALEAATKLRLYCATSRPGPGVHLIPHAARPALSRAARNADPGPPAARRPQTLTRQGTK